MTEPPIFVDASAWVALIDRADRVHPPARRFWRGLEGSRRRILTSTSVLDETYTLLRRRRKGRTMAMTLHDLLEASQVVEIAEVDASVRDDAWFLFVGPVDKILSFTDCTSFALMHHRKILEAFTFDGDFARTGFIALPERSWKV